MFVQCQPCMKCITNRYEDFSKVSSLKHQACKRWWIFHLVYEKFSHPLYSFGSTLSDIYSCSAELSRFVQSLRSPEGLKICWRRLFSPGQKGSPQPQPSTSKEVWKLEDIKQEKTSKTEPTLVVHLWPMASVSVFKKGVSRAGSRRGQGTTRQGCKE